MDTFRSLCSCLPLMDIVFEDEVCVDPLGVLEGRPNYANITFSELLAGLCIDRLEVMDEGPDYATALLSVLGLGAPYVGAFWSYGCRGVKLR